MAEAKKTTKKPPVAADKRKAADDALEARIASRKAAKPVEPSPVAEPLPFVPDTPKATKPVKEKKERKPREAKPKAEATADVKGMVENIAAKAVAKSKKESAALLRGMATRHKAEIKKLNAAHKALLAGLKKAHSASLKSMVPKQDLGAAEKKAYAAGVKAGEKAANKAITAALKGR